MNLFLSFLLTCSLLFSSVDKEETTISWDILSRYTSEIAELYDLDKYLLQAICEKESNFHVYAENGSCKGLMQISEKWHKNRMEKLNVDDIFDPYGNILTAADFIAELSEINDDPYYILMRYNMKTSTANELYEKGIISDYALSVVERADELRLINTHG